MRIISDFHDYYDIVQKYGIDLGITFQRKQEHHDIKFPWPSSSYKNRRKSKNATIPYISRLFFLGYCGKLVPCFLQITKKALQNYKDWDYISSYDSAYSYGEESNNLGFHMYDLDSAYDNDPTIEYNKEELKQLSNQNHSKWFYDYNTPVFLIYRTDFYHKNNLTPDVLITNPILEDLDFRHQKDQWTCYQDISQYISGVLTTEANPTIQISDRDM